MEALIEKLDAEFDTEKRGEIVKEMMQKILDDQAYCFMDNLKMSIVTTDKVSGVIPHPSDYYQITADTAISK